MGMVMRAVEMVITLGSIKMIICPQRTEIVTVETVQVPMVETKTAAPAVAAAMEMETETLAHQGQMVMATAIGCQQSSTATSRN
jgi:hypothetical protein